MTKEEQDRIARLENEFGGMSAQLGDLVKAVTQLETHSQERHEQQDQLNEQKFEAFGNHVAAKIGPVSAKLDALDVQMIAGLSEIKRDFRDHKEKDDASHRRLHVKVDGEHQWNTAEHDKLHKRDTDHLKDHQAVAEAAASAAKKTGGVTVTQTQGAEQKTRVESPGGWTISKAAPYLYIAGGGALGAAALEILKRIFGF